jgi:phospholipid/cholesterol/gamma-HCH transport system substrate-binding protein
MQNHTVETLIGAVVVAVAVVFLAYAIRTTDSGRVSGYDVAAVFDTADGVNPGTDVRLHGIKVGTVSSLSLDPKTYQAIVHISFREGVAIPDDSSIRVTSSGLLGSSFLSVQPGGSAKMLTQGGKILDTQGSIDLMSLIGRMLYGNTPSTPNTSNNSGTK